MHLAAVLLAVFATAAAPPPAGLDRTVWRRGFDPDRGFVLRGSVYGVAEDYSAIDNYLRHNAVVADVRPKTGRPARIYGLPDTRLFPLVGPAVFKVTPDAFHANLQGAPHTDLFYDRLELAGLKYFSPATPAAVLNDYYIERADFTLWELQPVDRAAFRAEDPTDTAVSGDLLPLTPDVAKLFVAEEGLVSAWHGQAVVDNMWPRQRNIAWKREPGAGVALPAREPFQVYGDRKNWFFLLRDGTIISSSAPAKGEVRSQRVFHRSAAAPVRALVTDVATNRTFAFASKKPLAGAAWEGTYFELAPGGAAKAKPFRRTPSKDERDAPRGIGPLLGLSRFLAEEKAIVLTKPAKGDPDP